MKKIQLSNNRKTYDLLIERDTGNEILILMSQDRKRCLDNWKKLKRICETAIIELEGLKEVTTHE
jgi:hypothetical protein